MMKALLSFVTALLLVLSLPVSGAFADDAKAKEIELIYSGAPTKPYKQIGLVSTGRDKFLGFFGAEKSDEEMESDLKKAAAKRGADAVMNVKNDITGLSGVAIKYEAPAAVKEAPKEAPATPTPAAK